jgi:RNA polymerase subunit RPABC4/transcription elongation factor Spt4
MLRPRETLSEQYVRSLEEESLLANIENQEFCPTCARRVDGDMQFCPSCHTKLRNACGNCGRPVHLSWDLCPYCGSQLTPEVPVTKISKPQPKQMAAPSTQQIAGATTAQSVVKPVPAAKVSVLDRMGNAIGSVVDKVSPPKQTTPQSDAADVVDEPFAPPATPAKTNGAPPQAPRPITQSKQTQANREELE